MRKISSALILSAACIATSIGMTTYAQDAGDPNAPARPERREGDRQGPSGRPPGRGGGGDFGPGGGPGGPGGGPGGGRSMGTAEQFVARLFAFDANKDGKLTKEELADARLDAIFTRADKDGDGNVTKQELTALFETESKAAGGRGDFAGGPGGPDGPGPRGFPGGGPGGFEGVDAFQQDGGGPGGPGGGFGPPRGGPGGGFGGGRMGPPKPGTVLPAAVQERLALTDDQKKAVAELQKTVDAKLATILTEEQRSQLSQIGPRQGGPRPQGPGGEGGGNGGPDGPPPR